MDCGKVVVCDEAHKYFDGKAKDGLAGAVVDTVRLMRHEGIRVVISTQSPLTMPTELLELSTLAIFHSFHSSDWYKYLAAKLPLPEGGFDCVRRLQPGEALVCCSTNRFWPARLLEQRYFRHENTTTVGRGSWVFTTKCDAHLPSSVGIVNWHLPNLCDARGANGQCTATHIVKKRIILDTKSIVASARAHVKLQRLAMLKPLETLDAQQSTQHSLCKDKAWSNRHKRARGIINRREPILA